MADVYQRRDQQRKPFRQRQLLGREGARDVYVSRGISKLRPAGGKSFANISEVGGASGATCVLRRDGAFAGPIQKNQRAHPDDYRTLRRGSARGVHLLQATHAVRNGGGQGEALFDRRPVGPSGNAHTESGSGWIKIWRGQRARPKQTARGMVRLDAEGRG